MRKYKEALESMNITPYEASVKMGVSRQHMSVVLNGKKGTGAVWEGKWKSAFGELPEDDGIERKRSASPNTVYVKVEFDPKRCMAELGDGVEKRIRKAFTKVPDNVDEFVKLMVGSWKTGVLDAGKFFASADAGE